MNCAKIILCFGFLKPSLIINFLRRCICLGVGYLGLQKVSGPLVVLKTIPGASYNEIIKINFSDSDNKARMGQLIEINDDFMVAQVFEGTAGISLVNTETQLTTKPLELAVSKEMLGRVFDGSGQPIDNLGPVCSNISIDVNGRQLNPVAREYPRNFIQTGISSIDCLSTLIRGQKLPIFSGDGMPHDTLAVQIVNQANIADSSGDFAIIFTAMGISKASANYFRQAFEDSGVIERVVMFLNLSDDPIAKRILTPRCALTTAEYLAFEHNMHVLVIMTDITSYCEALREISSSKEEIPGRKGYPGYLYSDLASLYERAGIVKEKNGSVTQIPILTMPNDDITHPIPDLTGYITEGQIVLERALFQKGIYPPVSILPSLSRLMKDGIGEKYTREDHADLANQLFAAYANLKNIRALVAVIGEDELSDIDKRYMEFGRRFEAQFLSQKFDENRSIEQTLNLGWELLGVLPKTELSRVDTKTLDKYYIPASM